MINTMNTKNFPNKNEKTDMKELLDSILSYSEKGINIEKTAQKIIDSYGNLNTVLDSDPIYLMNNIGINEQSAVLFSLISKVSRHYFTNKALELPFDSVANVAFYFNNFLRNTAVEKLIATAVKSNMKVIETAVISSGTSQYTKFEIRKIIEFAINCDADYIFICHNHPSGNVQPSDSDIVITRKIADFMNKIRIPLIDHIIVGRDNNLSMLEVYGQNIFPLNNSNYKVRKL